MSDNPANPKLAERLRTVRAGLRSDLEVTRHTFRGEPSYVVRNPITFASHNFSKADYQVLIELDSEKSLGDVFDELVAAGKLQQRQEDEFYAFILSLQQFGFLNLPITDGKALYSRFQKRQLSQQRAKLTGFLFWRVPLLNPDAMLDRTMRYAAPLFSRFAFVLWLALMLICGGILWQRWGDFKEPLQSILVTKNLVGMWILLVLLKVIHEFGHAYVCKMYGGKVPEMGAYFICFTPCAYVDASAAWGFASKQQRIAVSLGGMYVESIVAGMAVLIWNATGPSLVNSFAHQTIVLASIVTIGFNINPLMRYDGYYILSDLVEIPNLREQSATQVKAVCKRWLLGIRGDVLPYSLGGRALLFAYGVCSSFWKVSLVVAICAGVALKIYILGAIMAVVYGSMVVWGMIAKFVSYLWKSPETAPVRGRAFVVGAAVLVGVPLGIAAIPIYMPTEAHGVVAAGTEMPVCAQTSGFLKESDVVPGQQVKADAVLYVLDNLPARSVAEMSRAKLDLVRLEAECELDQDPAAAAMTRRREEHARRTLRKANRDVDELLIRAPLAGKVVECDAVPKMGRFVKEGERVATITSGDWTVRTLTTAEDLADTRPRVGQEVRVRLSSDAGEEFSGTITDVAVTGSNKISDASLTQLGGGTIAVAPDTMTAAEPFFEITIKLDNANSDIIRQGTTAMVSFATQPQTIGTRLYRSALRFINKLRT
ncbi:MAG: HlyD family efflux transporter periplasmic adaptor subunit [Pirellulales bacterium]|nr:HlyD family efflux transporter periplasmic adaptor subunit [Pirellulales bacterium]